MANQDYSELFCQAVDTIVKQRLESVSYDTTIICTIIDDSLAKDGIYTVTNNGTTKFDAVSSDISYRNNNTVYVQIPGGDWNQQKIIIGKKTDKTNEPYVYKKPFSSLVDITGNLISSNINSNETGLIANAYSDLSDAYNDRYQAVTLWSYNLNDSDALRKEEGSNHSAYTRLGIQASFQSWLNPFYMQVLDDEGNVLTEESSIARSVVQGDYGLRLRVYTVNEETSKGSQGEGAAYDMYLNCADMNGNPYDFQSFYSQEKVFDISTIGQIAKMELQFYQTPKTFKDKDGNESPYQDFLGHFIKPNLYVSEPYISLGYDINEFDDEMVTIYTFDSSTYSRTADPLTNNHKHIHLRWIHKQDDGSFKSITEKDNMSFEVRWYRYELGHSSADQYSGVYWKNLSLQQTSNGNSQYTIQDDEWNTYNKTCSAGYKREPGFFKSWILPNTTLAEEQIKAIIIYNGQPYRSNILVCENENEVVSGATLDAVQALSINCDDNTYGNYRIYNMGNSLIDYSQSAVVREWRPYFMSSADGETSPTELIEASEIEWIIPTEKTMIVVDEAYYGGEHWIDENDDKRLHIKRYGSGTKGNDISEYNTQRYRIRSYYSQVYSDNTIQCKIKKDGIVYTATKELTFGVAGTTGTDCTFILDFDNGVTAVTDNSTSVVTVTARLYDYENKEISLEGRNIAWAFKNGGDDLLTISSLPESYRREIKRNTAITWNNTNYNILQASMEWGDTTLYAYLPIPIRSSSTYAYISGTTQVIYNSAGEVLDYFKNPYIIYNSNAEEVSPSTVSWSVVNNNAQEDGVYSPQITVGRDGLEYLTPLSFYVEGACEKVCITGKIGSDIVWAQPLLIIQNRYPSAMINKWDGSLDVGTTDPGTILAPRLVAGMKHSEDNTFSGVMLGNWGDQNADNSLTSGDTGLYGFDHGEQTYAFKQDGTAFIGKSGKGRIEFDGTNAIIQSGAFNAGTGMSIDLAQGTIDAHTFTLTAGKNGSTPTGGSNNTILIDTTASDYPLQIGSNFSVNWNGDLSANNATFDNGTFYGDIYASGGELGNLTVTGTLTGGSISGSSISGGTLTGAYITNGSTFSVSSDGTLVASAATITGTINASGGTITGNMTVTGTLSGGTISGATISGGTVQGATITGGSLNIGSGNFAVNSNGVLTAKGGTIGGWTFGLSTGTSGDIATNWNALYGYYGGKYTVLDPGRQNVITVGTSSTPGPNANFNDAPFRVLYNGTMYATSGEIAGWTITENGFSSGDFTLNKSGTFTGGITIDSLKVTGTTTLGGTLNLNGSLKVNTGSITAGNTTINSSGISCNSISITSSIIWDKATLSKTSSRVLTGVSFNRFGTFQRYIYSIDIDSDGKVTGYDRDYPRYYGLKYTYLTLNYIGYSEGAGSGSDEE